MKTNLGLSFSLERIKEKKHFLCTDLEVWFVLEGSIDIEMNQTGFCMEREGIILFNPGSAYVFKSREKNILCRAGFSTELLHRVLAGTAPLLTCNSAMNPNLSYQTVQNIFYELLEFQVRPIKQTGCMADSLMLKLLDCLITDFQTGKKTDADAKDSETETGGLLFQQMIRYINMNYQSEINLSALAEDMFVSASTLSRLFHRYAGVYFADYVNQIRLRHACEDLILTQKNLTRVAVDNGFSSSSAFNRVFKKEFNMTPSAYRQSHIKEEADRQKEKDGAQERLRMEVIEKNLLQTDDMEHCMLEISDKAEGKKWDKNWNTVINIGAMYEMTLANIQYHVLYLQEHLNFSYVRVWNLFSKRLMISDGQTKGSYNFMMIDQVLDFLLKNKLRPFFDLGRKPNVIKKADDNIIRYEEEFIEFRSREIWEDCMVKLFRHLIDRYGIDEMSNWIFELSRDGVHQDVGYYEDADYAFFDAYQFSYRLIRECIPSAKIGGAASIIYSDWEYLTDFYQKCVDADCVPDFVSQIIFPYIPFEKKQNHQRMRISQERDTEVQQVQMMRELMQKAGVKDCKLYVSEFNNSVSNRNMLNDSCFRGAYYCKKISEIAQYVDMICIMAGSDWINSYMDFNNPANGGVGMLTKDTICKPAYWAVAFLNMLGSKLLIQSDYYIATKNSSGEYFILCQNFKWFHKKYYLQPENIDLRHDMDLFFEDDAQAEIGIRISDLEEGQYVVKSRRMNREEGSLLAEWAKLDFTSDLTRQDIRYLRTASFPRLQIQKQQTKDSALQISIKLQPHEVCMIHIYRLDRAY